MEITKQRLTHGKALCGKVFKNFVETFNWLVDFGTNLKGDKDTANQSGHITVDNADPKHPVIRCDGCASEGEDLEKFTVHKKGNDNQHVTLDASGNGSASVSVSDGSRSATLDTSALAAGESLSFHTLTVNHPNSTSSTYKVLSSSDITVNESESGGGGGSSTTIDVVVGIEFNLNDTSLECKLIKKQITTSSVSNVSTSFEEVLALTKADVVTSIMYNADGNHMLHENTQPVTVFDIGTAHDPGTIFTAVPHSEYGENGDNGDSES